jgi:hypothetical protein
MAQPKDTDSQLARSVPAIYVDSFLVETDETLTRITLGEGTTDVRDRIRAAIIMPVSDAKELAKIIQELIEKTERKTDKGAR